MNMLPQNLNEWLLCLTVVAIGVDRALSFWKAHLKEQPDPATTYATKQALGEHRREHKADIQALREEVKTALEKLEGEMRSLSHDRRTDVRTLHQEIRKVDNQCAALTASSELLNQELKNIGAKIDRFIAAQANKKR